MLPFIEMLGNTLLSGSEIVQTRDCLQGKVVGLLFSAQWCGQCRLVSRHIGEWYSRSLAAKGFEIVFVSSDVEQQEFDEYYAGMPWKALPFADRQRKEMLVEKYEAVAIPMLVLLDLDGSVIRKDGRMAIANDPTGAKFPWKPSDESRPAPDVPHVPPTDSTPARTFDPASVPSSTPPLAPAYNAYPFGTRGAPPSAPAPAPASVHKTFPFATPTSASAAVSAPAPAAPVRTTFPFATPSSTAPPVSDPAPPARVHQVHKTFPFATPSPVSGHGPSLDSNTNPYP